MEIHESDSRSHRRRRAAAYVRMSTDHQELSIGLQMTAIQAYADAQDFELVAVYEDAAKSGLEIKNRAGMKRLLRDVMEEPRPFDVVLVYDVSRWGRFQDIDAAAYYEYTCRMNGAAVIYVKEMFGTAQDPMTALLKTHKRAMAAEYARELGVKCRDGQDRAIQLGYQVGPLPPHRPHACGGRSARQPATRWPASAQGCPERPRCLDPWTAVGGRAGAPHLHHVRR